LSRNRDHSDDLPARIEGVLSGPETCPTNALMNCAIRSLAAPDNIRLPTAAILPASAI